MRLSIVVPVLDEAPGLGGHLARLQPLRAHGAEVIVVDGGSRDGSRDIAAPLADAVLVSAPGRALQLNAGAAAAGGDALLFLHADSHLPAGADRLVAAALQRHRWGRFDVEIAGRHPMFGVIATMMNLRSRLTDIATGDQAMFLRRAEFEALGGFAPIALMEDVELSRRLRRRGAPACLRDRVVTSGRRWESRGVWRTIWLMWRLRLAFWCGADPAALARRYR